MQATVYHYDADTASGSVVTDAGVLLGFEIDALRLSGLRHLRPGQRLSVELTEDGRIARLTLGSIGARLRERPQSRS